MLTFSTCVQDPSYDPYGYAKVATRTASSVVGAPASCPANVQAFFKTLFTMAETDSGLQDINTQLSLCSDSQVKTADDVNQTLASFVRIAWTNAVRLLSHLLSYVVLRLMQLQRAK